MIVSQLIELLKLVPQDLEVIKSKDAEGNGYDTVYSVEVSLYDDRDELHPIHEDDIADGEYDPEDIKGFKKGLFIW
tara:strand:- start:14723 stop:14950 length:228 start_codon:yes stop_codon:yes gene_type:complete